MCLLSWLLISCSPAPVHTPAAEADAPSSATPLPVRSSATSNPGAPEVLTGLTPEPPLAAAVTTNCAEGRGQMTEHQLDSDRLAKPMAFRVYTPPCYRASSAQRYPVLYLIHGLTFTADQWDRLGIDETADQLISAKEISPLIIVLPQDDSARQPTEDPFGTVLVEELVPWIDDHYPTQAEPAGRAVGGLSRGAGWAVHLGVNYWQMFGRVGAHSLPIFWTDAARLEQRIAAIPAEELPRFYIDIGTKDPELRNVIEFEALLTRYQVPHEWRLNDGYHEEAYWSAHLAEYLSFYSEAWDSP